nr:PREDICTED: probable complex I intermediate-associated protein 30, mitochondrial isoform X2 [Megachile rotundata]
MLRPLNSYFRTFIINKRRFHTNNCLYEVYERPRSGYPLVYDEPPITKDKSFREKLKIGYNIFKNDCNLFAQEVRAKFGYGVTAVSPFEENVIFKFDGTEKSLKEWIVNYDSVYNEGFSTAKLELSPSGTGIFHGILNTTVPKDGRLTRSGYCNITTIPKYKSFGRKYYYDWSSFNRLILRVRGDGRCYME